MTKLIATDFLVVALFLNPNSVRVREVFVLPSRKTDMKKVMKEDMMCGCGHQCSGGMYCKKAMGFAKLIAGLLLLAGALHYLTLDHLEWFFGVVLVVIGLWKLSKKCGCEQCQKMNW